jgi:hypothetical protein
VKETLAIMDMEDVRWSGWTYDVLNLYREHSLGGPVLTPCSSKIGGNLRRWVIPRYDVRRWTQFPPLEFFGVFSSIK